jgi:hypothetical protein
MWSVLETLLIKLIEDVVKSKSTDWARFRTETLAL